MAKVKNNHNFPEHVYVTLEDGDGDDSYLLASKCLADAHEGSDSRVSKDNEDVKLIATYSRNHVGKYALPIDVTEVE